MPIADRPDGRTWPAGKRVSRSEKNDQSVHEREGKRGLRGRKKYTKGTGRGGQGDGGEGVFKNSRLLEHRTPSAGQKKRGAAELRAIPKKPSSERGSWRKVYGNHLVEGGRKFPCEEIRPPGKALASKGREPREGSASLKTESFETAKAMMRRAEVSLIYERVLGRKKGIV